jgi:hypothetical protein
MEEKLYSPYFDNRLYLIELYMDCIARILEGSKLDRIMNGLMQRYQELLIIERDFFLKQFPDTSLHRFESFVRECEYEHLLHKRLRPYIVGIDVTTLCTAIDILKDDTYGLKEDTRERFQSDLQERLLIVSHYQMQDLLNDRSLGMHTSPDSFKLDNDTLIPFQTTS